MIPAAENLNGWWHAYLDASNPWKPEQDALSSPLPHPTGGWEALETRKRSLSVPGIWRDHIAGYVGIIWYERPLWLEADWKGVEGVLEIARFCEWLQVFLNGKPVGQSVRAHQGLALALGVLRPECRYSLGVCLWAPDDRGGIASDVILRPAAND
ncbi:MAG: hypothetical protein GXY52_09625 [Chloroflexi bacterium]|nr:hypothetical protein [Chloroflexota bacterium]